MFHKLIHGVLQDYQNACNLVNEKCCTPHDNNIDEEMFTILDSFFSNLYKDSQSVYHSPSQTYVWSIKLRYKTRN